LRRNRNGLEATGGLDWLRADRVTRVTLQRESSADNLVLEKQAEDVLCSQRKEPSTGTNNDSGATILHNAIFMGEREPQCAPRRVLDHRVLRWVDEVPRPARRHPHLTYRLFVASAVAPNEEHG
jgi:hypothetical protein